MTVCTPYLNARNKCRVLVQSMPQWLWSPVLEGVTFAVSKATSLHEAAASISQLPPCFTSALLPNVRVSGAQGCFRIVCD